MDSARAAPATAPRAMRPKLALSDAFLLVLLLLLLLSEEEEEEEGDADMERGTVVVRDMAAERRGRAFGERLGSKGQRSGGTSEEEKEEKEEMVHEKEKHASITEVRRKRLARVFALVCGVAREFLFMPSTGCTARDDAAGQVVLGRHGREIAQVQ